MNHHAARVWYAEKEGGDLLNRFREIHDGVSYFSLVVAVSVCPSFVGLNPRKVLHGEDSLREHDENDGIMSLVGREGCEWGYSLSLRAKGAETGWMKAALL